MFTFGEKLTLNILRWKTINYTEEKGLFEKLFGKEKENYGGEFLDPLVYITDISDSFKDIERNKGLKLLGFFGIYQKGKENYFDNYIRKKKIYL